jgi:hypothetical protein
MLRLLIFLACIPAVFALCVQLDAQPLAAAQSSGKKQSAQQNATAHRQASASKSGAADVDPQALVPEPDVYAVQPPYTEKELVKFIENMPHFLAWARVGKVKVRPVVNAAGKPDFAYTLEAAAKAQELGWEPRRFFCLLGRSAAALYLVEEGTDSMNNASPPDMPTVTAAEMALVRKHLASLLRAGAGGPTPSISR